MKKKIIRGFLILFALAVSVFLAEAIRIATFPSAVPADTADCAIVLGAAVIGDRPSPVFEGRLEHGVALFRRGKVKQLILTGGRSVPNEPAESEVGRIYAMTQGVPDSAILTEDRSHTTRDNLIEAKKLMSQRDLRNAVVVSDPLHLRRALLMAEGLEIDAAASGAPGSRYVSWNSKLPFLLRETFFSFVYRFAGK